MHAGECHQRMTKITSALWTNTIVDDHSDSNHPDSYQRDGRARMRRPPRSHIGEKAAQRRAVRTGRLVNLRKDCAYEGRAGRDNRYGSDKVSVHEVDLQ